MSGSRRRGTLWRWSVGKLPLSRTSLEGSLSTSSILCSRRSMGLSLLATNTLCSSNFLPQVFSALLSLRDFWGGCPLFMEYDLFSFVNMSTHFDRAFLFRLAMACLGRHAFFVDSFDKSYALAGFGVPSHSSLAFCLWRVGHRCVNRCMVRVGRTCCFFRLRHACRSCDGVGTSCKMA